MVSLDDFSRLVSGIHASATDPELWSVTVGDMGRAFDGANVGLVVGCGPSRVLEHASISTSAVLAYAEHYARLDHFFASVQAGPVGAVRTAAELMSPYQNCEFDADWARPNGLEDGLFMRLTSTPSATSVAIATPRRRERFDTTEHVALLRHLAPHLQQTLQMQSLLRDADRQSHGLAAAGEALRHGIIVVTLHGTIIYANHAAEAILRLQDGLRSCAGRLQASTSHDDGELQYSISLALSAEPRTGRAMLCSRTSGSHGYLVHVSPLRARAVGGSISIEPSALIVIVDPERQLTLPAVILQRLFGLTASEAQVALMVVDSHGLKAIADELSVSLATVKSHLNRVFQKTDTHRQSELVRLLLSLDPLLH